MEIHPGDRCRAWPRCPIGAVPTKSNFPQMRKRVVILASGQGSLAQAIIDASDLEIQIVAVVSDRADAQVLERAKKASINTTVVELTADRQQWNKQLFEAVDQYSPD